MIIISDEIITLNPDSIFNKISNVFIFYYISFLTLIFFSGIEVGIAIIIYIQQAYEINLSNKVILLFSSGVLLTLVALVMAGLLMIKNFTLTVRETTKGTNE